MQIRKLVKSGLSSFVVALPKDFIEKNKLQKGDLIYIEQNSKNELTITTEFNERSLDKKTKVIECDNVPFSTVKRELTSAYLDNYYEIIIRGKEIPKHIKEIAEASGVDRKILHRNYKHLIRNLNLRVVQSDPTDFVYKFATKLKLSAETQTLAVEIIEKAKKKAITSGKSPVGIVGGAIYIASMINKEKRTQSQIAKEIGATEVTVRNRYKDLIDNLDLQGIEA